ncbi:MAG TPA: hypothetical protein VGM88_26260 [Kofleriaceae bacterium]
MTDDHTLDDIRTLGEELRAVFVSERRAIAALDHGALSLLADEKRALADQLRAACAAAPASAASVIRPIVAAIRTEAHATSMLAAAATEAVRALLGIQPNGYDRRARPREAPSLRLLAAY